MSTNASLNMQRRRFDEARSGLEILDHLVLSVDRGCPHLGEIAQGNLRCPCPPRRSSVPWWTIPSYFISPTPASAGRSTLVSSSEYVTGASRSSEGVFTSEIHYRVRP